ncbi:AAA family ATPase [Paenibacillus taichungensis]|uniref:AAA family ATPase n=1 Tax=Paenibacillus taichungensis TaxID=484184 RepID=UPI002DB974B0|nr:AAA family ATPase [Paenibacillus taichungensis]MEC0106886.1 AAA family ATPase [Paenibacillus taichungensis]MEC0195184.1 AAA family ATPase [Paenibacillus taichungensis]
MIKGIEVRGLNQRENYNLIFNDDINIFTGKNGTGKTTLLKLVWYLISGNIEKVFEEIDFNYVRLDGDRFSIEIINKVDHIDGAKSNSEDKLTEIRFTVDNITRDYEFPTVLFNRVTRGPSKRNSLDFINELNHDISYVSGGSVFFPTFRRIEGGFSMENYNGYMRAERFQDAISSIAESLSTTNHTFITSVSTRDIVELLTRHYANISEHTNKLHIELSTYIETKIKAYSKYSESASYIPVQSDKGLLDNANQILHEIQDELGIISAKRESFMKPFNVLNDLINQIFQQKGIKVTDKITLGETKEAMFSDKLSAGEKQMLSFLCYNAFTRKSSIFIDEPEISLHVDWQRTLFPTLMSQSSNNQFFVATHSPFIYSKYEDKEILLSDDRGGY